MENEMKDKKNNTGIENTGHSNTGNYNTGNRNAGDYNTGNYNAGSCNAGDCNTGDCNAGNYNAGNYNVGDCNTGFFNTDEPTMRLFNKDSGLKRSQINVPFIELKLTEWISEKDMSDEQKKNDPEFRVRGGMLLTRTYKEAWALAWKEMKEETRKELLSLPNFDAKIFEEITGIDVGQKESSCDGKIVEIEGKKYQLKELTSGE